ncbi:hypothetical protein BKA69DRAFT_495926 [Paraphysoderma sedebokerense]|nr:hypothetical protein BKA69DRAFT_495926 [Paraphysoderma sedebokerense]
MLRFLSPTPRINNLSATLFKIFLIPRFILCVTLSWSTSVVRCRYDVRNLLHTRSELDSFSRPSTTPSVPTDLLEEERQCDEERYKDVDSDEEMIFDMSDDEREEYIEEKNKRKEMAEKGRVWKFDYGKSPWELNENNDTGMLNFKPIGSFLLCQTTSSCTDVWNIRILPPQ